MLVQTCMTFFLLVKTYSKELMSVVNGFQTKLDSAVLYGQKNWDNIFFKISPFVYIFHFTLYFTQIFKSSEITDA